MMYTIKTFCALFVLALSLSLALPTQANPTDGDPADTLQEVNREVDDAVKSIGEYSEAKRDEAVKKIRKALNRADNEIERLEEGIRSDWHTMTEPARKQAKEVMKDLRQKRNQLGERFGELQAGSADAWADMKQGFSDAWSEFKSSWTDAFDSAQTDDKQ